MDFSLISLVFLFVGLVIGFGMASYFWAARLKSEQQLYVKQEELWKSQFKEIAADVLEKSAKNQIEALKTENNHELDKKKQTFDQSFEEIRKNLKQTSEQIHLFEKERVDQYSKLDRTLVTMIEQEKKLATETERLKSALTTSQSVRGRWGELVLRNILSQTELVRGIDFVEQYTTSNDIGGSVKPDVVIRLPQSGQHLVIDAKTSLYESYIDAESNPSESERRQLYNDFSNKLWTRVLDLASKEYQKHVSDSLPYVILFIPSEAAIRAAFDSDTNLFQKAMEKKVFICSPATIIPLILLIGHGWRQHNMTKQATELGKVVEQLGQRLSTFIGRLGKVQKGIEQASTAWNEAIDKSWNGQQSVQKSIERARELGAQIEVTETFEGVTTSTRELPNQTINPA